MADLIKKIKIKKQDGTFTDYIPIGAEAQNVSTTDGDSVQLKLNKKPYYYNTVADMKADTKLKAGDIVIILGYNNVNDGVRTLLRIEIASDTIVDGKNDCFLLTNGLVAKRIKVKNTLALSPTLESNETVSNLTIVNTDTSSGSAGVIFSGKNDTILENSDVTGGYWSARIGNENDANTTKNIKLINNKLTSPHGVSLRHKSNSNLDDNGNHVLFLNDVNNTENHPGIESWAERTKILFNNIKNISGSVGGTGGITLGSRKYQIVDGNMVDNFSYGIEVGNSKLNIISNCIIKNCSTGIICSSSPTADCLIENCIVIVPENGRGIEFANNSALRIKVSNCIFMYGESMGDYNDSTSRKGYGIYSTSGGHEVTFENCTFMNFSQVQCYSGTKFINCGFYNNEILYINKATSFVNCIFKDCNSLSVMGANDGTFITFTSCSFIRSDDNTTTQYYMVNQYSAGIRPIAKFINCTKKNCEYLTQVANTTAGGRDIMMRAQYIDGIWYTYNLASLSALKTGLNDNNGYTLSVGSKIVDTYNKRIWNVMPEDMQVAYYESIPTAGAFKKGDKIYNNFRKSYTVEYWLCTTAGEFGTENEPVFVAHNV